MKLGIIGEDRADTASLKTIVMKIGEQHSVQFSKILQKGYTGWSEMFKRAVAQIEAFIDLGCRHFIVCHDADGPDPEPNRAKVDHEIFAKLSRSARSCPIIPVYEIEAWFLADLEAVQKVFRTANVGKPIPNPERVKDPKRELRRRTKHPKTKKIQYQEGCDNEAIALHLNPNTVAEKCPQFKKLVDFICSS